MKETLGWSLQNEFTSLYTELGEETVQPVKNKNSKKFKKIQKK